MKSGESKEQKMNSNILTNNERIQIEAIYYKAKKAAMWNAYFVMSIVVHTTITSGVMGFEYELMYRLFEYLGGEDSAFWTSGIMGFSSFIVVLGFHFLAESHPHHSAITFINRAVELLMPIFLLGIGAVLAVLIFNSGLRELLTAHEDIVFAFDTVEEAVNKQDWLTALMSHVTTPMAALSFSLGLGSLAILNVFIAHRSLTTIKKGVTEYVERRSTFKLVSLEYAIILAAEKAYIEKRVERDAQRAIVDDEVIRVEMSSEILAVIHDQLQPAKLWLNDQTMKTTPLSFTPNPTLNVKQIATAVKAISAITLDDINIHLTATIRE
jgi:hypothetical protein